MSELLKKIAMLQLNRKIITWDAMDKELADILTLAREAETKVKNVSSNSCVMPSLPIEDIDAEMVKRWYQKLTGMGEEEMKVDIRAMAKAAELHRELK